MGARAPQQAAWKLAQITALSTAGFFDPLPIEEYMQVSIIASLIAETSCDPITCQIDLDYGQLYQPSLPLVIRDVGPEHGRNLFASLPSPKLVSLLNKTIRSQWMAAMTELAILRTVHRRHTALEYDDAITAEAQSVHRTALIARVKTVQQETMILWNQVLEEIEGSKIETKIITARAQEAYLDKINAQGFSALEMKLLRAAGIHPIDIHWASRAMLLVEPPRKDRTVPDIFADVRTINTFDTVYECACEHPKPVARTSAA